MRRTHEVVVLAEHPSCQRIAVIIFVVAAAAAVVSPR
mgnify:CR=1 FL=1